MTAWWYEGHEEATNQACTSVSYTHKPFRHEILTSHSGVFCLWMFPILGQSPGASFRLYCVRGQSVSALSFQRAGQPYSPRSSVLKAPAPTRVVSIVISIRSKRSRALGDKRRGCYEEHCRTSGSSCYLQAFTTPMVSVMFLGLRFKPAMMPEIVVLDEVT
jgi:hypothetical protein